MKTLSNDVRSSALLRKQEKVQLNLKKINKLLKEALSELKQSSRFSTNESDSSQNQSPYSVSRKTKDPQKKETETFLKSLEKGYVMVKHSQKSKPKQKYIYISVDRRYLCWKSLEKNDEKKIELRKIDSVLRGEEETIFFVSSKSIKSLERLVMIRSQIRSLQLQALNQEQSAKFQLQIMAAIQNAKMIHCSNKS